jgi:hypothetical protein
VLQFKEIPSLALPKSGARVEVPRTSSQPETSSPFRLFCFYYYTSAAHELQERFSGNLQEKEKSLDKFLLPRHNERQTKPGSFWERLRGNRTVPTRNLMWIMPP